MNRTITILISVLIPLLTGIAWLSFDTRATSEAKIESARLVNDAKVMRLQETVFRDNERLKHVEKRVEQIYSILTKK